MRHLSLSQLLTFGPYPFNPCTYPNALNVVIVPVSTTSAGSSFHHPLCEDVAPQVSIKFYPLTLNVYLLVLIPLLFEKKTVCIQPIYSTHEMYTLV